MLFLLRFLPVTGIVAVGLLGFGLEALGVPVVDTLLNWATGVIDSLLPSWQDLLPV